MTTKGVNRTEVLQTLADKLPDRIINDLFPGLKSSAVRDVIAGRAERAESPAQQQNLFSELSSAGEQHCSLFTDGASRGNPGEAGAGIVLLDKAGRELAARSLYLGQCTNNIAEYKALLLGLRTARELNCSTVAVFMDSQLIVRQLQGAYKVKNAGLKPLFDDVKGLLAQFREWNINHVPRAQNKRADELANRGIDDKEE